jgi:triphosphoribosyl-dephospho-CoA synthetase
LPLQRLCISLIDEAEIWRVANLLVKRHGTHAALAAAQRAQELLAAGEVNGYAVWKCILVAAAELSRTKLAEGERVN